MCGGNVKKRKQKEGSIKGKHNLPYKKGTIVLNRKKSSRKEGEQGRKI